MSEGGNGTRLRTKVSEGEWQTRVGLAAAFGVAYHLGRNNTANNQITARVPDEPDNFLMNPRGLGWHEITASSMSKADFAGNIVSETEHTLAPARLNFHSAIPTACSMFITRRALSFRLSGTV